MAWNLSADPLQCTFIDGHDVAAVGVIQKTKKSTLDYILLLLLLLPEEVTYRSVRFGTYYDVAVLLT